MRRGLEIAAARGEAVAVRTAVRLEAAMRVSAPGARVMRDGATVTAEGRGVGAVVWPAGLLR